MLCALVLWPGAKAVLAQSSQVDVNSLTSETQKMAPEVDKMTMVWWVPNEFWQASLSQDPTITKTQVEQFIKILSPYSLFVVVDGKIGAYGGVTYKTEQAIRDSIQLIDSQGAVYRPLARESIDAETASLLSVMKPVLSNMMGQLGQNMNFVLFPAKDKAGQPLLSPRREGSFTIKLSEHTFKWRLPLGSLLPPKICPVDGEQLNGAWKYCPWHGKELLLKGR